MEERIMYTRDARKILTPKNYLDAAKIGVTKENLERRICFGWSIERATTQVNGTKMRPSFEEVKEKAKKGEKDVEPVKIADIIPKEKVKELTDPRLDVSPIRRGDIYYVAAYYQHTGTEQKPGRPGLVISNNAGNRFSSHIEIAYMTLQDKKPLPTHVIIQNGKCKGSTVLCEQITSVSIDRLGNFMDHLGEADMKAVDKALAASLDLKLADETDSEVNKLKEELKKATSSAESAWEMVSKAKRIDIENEAIKDELKMYKAMYDQLLSKVVGR